MIKYILVIVNIFLIIHAYNYLPSSESIFIYIFSGIGLSSGIILFIIDAFFEEN
jgi:hypothetical protein